MAGQQLLFPGREDTLARAQKRVKDGMKQPEGIECPCCGQLCKVYKRKLTSAMAAWLIWLVRIYQRDGRWVHVTEHRRGSTGGGGDYAKLVYWGLIEQMSQQGEPEKRSSGYWRPTDRGIDFVHARVHLRSHVLVFDGDVRGFEGELLGIREALGKRFRYDELMQAEIQSQAKSPDAGQTHEPAQEQVWRTPGAMTVRVDQ
jgi:hypothetical protein